MRETEARRSVGQDGRATGVRRGRRGSAGVGAGDVYGNGPSAIERGRAMRYTYEDVRTGGGALTGTSLVMPSRLKEALRDYATEREVSMSKVICVAIAEHLAADGVDVSWGGGAGEGGRRRGREGA